jgi:hypothetical protein
MLGKLYSYMKVVLDKLRGILSTPQEESQQCISTLCGGLWVILKISDILVILKDILVIIEFYILELSYKVILDVLGVY